MHILTEDWTYTMHDIWIPFSLVLLTVTALVNGKYRMRFMQYNASIYATSYGCVFNTFYSKHL